MDLIDVLRTTGATRAFNSEPVTDEALRRVLDTARFAPSGGNRQGWHVVVVKDATIRRQLRDLYVAGWTDYLAMTTAGLTPWSPLADRADEATVLAKSAEAAAPAGVPGNSFAAHFHEVPALLALFADLGVLAAVDRDAGRYTFAGGASIYPFAWSILLAARAEALGGVVTTMPIRNEAAVKALLDAPDGLALAAVIALGHPVRQPRGLRRAPVDAFTTVDRVGGEPLPG